MGCTLKILKNCALLAIYIFFLFELINTHLSKKTFEVHTVTATRKTITMDRHSLHGRSKEAILTTSNMLYDETTSRLSQNRPFVFIHVGKAGGTTVDSFMSQTKQKYIGYSHFDWSWANMRWPQCPVLIVLRHPVQRAISQFYFSKKLSWTKGMLIRTQTIDEYFSDFQEMMATRGVWQDGEAGASWIAGTHIASWVKKDERFSIEKREETEKDSIYMCTVIEQRLKKAFWIGITETLREDIERLKTMIHADNSADITNNANPHPNAISQKTRDKIIALTTLDHWVYQNAIELKKNRAHSFTPCPELHPCRSTRYTIECAAFSPYGKVNYTWTN